MPMSRQIVRIADAHQDAGWLFPMPRQVKVRVPSSDAVRIAEAPCTLGDLLLWRPRQVPVFLLRMVTVDKRFALGHSVPDCHV